MSAPVAPPPFWRDGCRTSENGCCSAIEPCPHQQRNPNTLCETCIKAAEFRPASPVLAPKRSPVALAAAPAAVEAAKRVAEIIRDYIPFEDTHRYPSMTDLRLLLPYIAAAAALSRPEPGGAVGVPAGYALVPVEPTPEMVGAFWRVKNTGTTEIGQHGDDRSDYAAYRAMLAAAPQPAARDADALREEVAYWRRDASARMWSAQALMQAYRREGRDDLAFAHRDALRAAVTASEAVQRQDWHPTCELCPKPILPGEVSVYLEDAGLCHVRCACEGALDDTGAPDPSDAEWRERTVAGRAALSADDEDPEPARRTDPASPPGLAEVERLIREAVALGRSNPPGSDSTAAAAEAKATSAALDALRALLDPGRDVAEAMVAYRDASAWHAVTAQRINGEDDTIAAAEQAEAAEQAARSALLAAIALQRGGGAAVDPELVALSERAFNGELRVGPFKSGLLSDSPKGGDVKLFGVRGWGFYTGKGHGALGLHEAEAASRMDANAEFAAAAWNYARAQIAAAQAGADSGEG